MAVLALPVANARVWAGKQPVPAPGPATLTIPLDQWGTLAVTYRGRTVRLTTADVFATLGGK